MARQHDIQVKIRLNKALKDDLEFLANREHRSLAMEIVHRLTLSIQEEHRQAIAERAKAAPPPLSARYHALTGAKKKEGAK